MPIESGYEPDSADAFYLSEVSPDDRPWEIHRAAADRVMQLYSQVGFVRYSERMADCAQLLEFAGISSDLKPFILKLQSAPFCRVRFCPVCQWRRSLMWRARFFKVLPKIVADYPAARFIFLTLTVRNCQITELRKTLTWMNKAWRRLIERKQFPAIGFVKSVEVTKSDDGTAHPHFHVILMVDSNYFKRGYISHNRWVDLWQDCLRVNYKPSVHVKAIKPPKNADKYESSALDKAIVVAFCETLKYSTKESDLEDSASWLEELTRQLHKTRAISVGGVLRDYLSEDDPENLVDGDISQDELVNDDAPRFLFGWEEEKERYRKDYIPKKKRQRCD